MIPAPHVRSEISPQTGPLDTITPPFTSPQFMPQSQDGEL